MKKIIYAVILIAIVVVVILLFPEQNKNKVGLVYIAKAPAIDLALEGLEERLSALELEVPIEYANAYGEPKNINTIVSSFKQKNYDVIMALTTPCAQIAKQHISDKPIIFVGVSDPVGAKLVPSLENGFKNITGTMSQDPIFENVKFAKQIFPSIENIGIIYSTSESNSASIISNLEDSLSTSRLDLSIIKQPITQTSEILKAAESITEKVDIVLLINDNMVFSGSETILSVAKKKNIPVFASDIESVKKGALFTFGLNYKDEGIASADILYDIIVNKKTAGDIPIFINRKYYLYIHENLLSYNIDTTLVKNANVIK